MVSEVNSAIADHKQAGVTFAGKARERGGALHAESHTVVLDAVGDGSLDAGAPIPCLGESVGALGADVGGWDVVVAVGDGFQTLVLHQHVFGGASLANGGGGVGAVGETADDVVHDGASLAILEEVALLAVDAASPVVDGDAVGGAGLNAGAADGIIEIVGVALGAVKSVLHLEASS